MGAILDMQLRRLRERLADHRVTLELDDVGRSLLLDYDYHPACVAWLPNGAITRYPETPRARAIIAGHIPDGSTIDVTVDGDRLTFTPVIEGEAVDAG
jgi:ATP-dependent Clp protease ATP-binding subunit ClpB